MSFAKSIGKTVVEPIVVHQAGKEIDRFDGVFNYMKKDDRELVRIAFHTEGIHKREALTKLDDKDGSQVTDEDIQKAWKPINDKMSGTLRKWLVKGETNDDRDWGDNTLDELLELPEYRDGMFAALRRLADGDYLKDSASKN